MINNFYQYYIFEQPHLTSHNRPQKKNEHEFSRQKIKSWLGHAQKAGLNQLMQYQPDFQMLYKCEQTMKTCTYYTSTSKRLHSVRKMNDKTNMDMIIAGSVNALNQLVTSKDGQVLLEVPRAQTPELLNAFSCSEQEVSSRCRLSDYNTKRKVWPRTEI